MMPDAMSAEALSGGFADAPVQSAHAFRAALEAMARPGTIHDVTGAMPPAPLSVAAGVLILMLCDGTTPVHLAGAHDCTMVRDWITFHTGAPVVAADMAQYAVGVWDALQPIDRFAVGLPDYPDRSATLIVEMVLLMADGARLSGPGIQSHALLSVPDVAAFQANHALFPRGFDCFLTAAGQVAGLPRSARVEVI
jgi:alpha-D-ribose 1-methylphosphonate 5-triphosphate synthase subunit PhnH